MSCFHPLKGFYADKRNPETGKRSVQFSGSGGLYDRKVSVPCGKCIGCKLERSRQWAVRCMNEAQMHDKNCFVTLTFREACPLDGTKTDPTYSLYKHHFQRFIKRLRQEYYGDKAGELRYFHCGEYGEKFSRPHHHACLFGIDFEDKIFWKKENGIRLYVSEKLERIWQHGHCTVGEVTFESAAYVARYCTKKIDGENASYYYEDRIPEYSTMSRRPGIGSLWFERYNSDLVPKGFMVVRGRKSKIPKYYDSKLELLRNDDYVSLKGERNRVKRELEQKGNYHYRRLEDGEIIAKAMLGELKRKIE